jgi:hypothetical protein
MQALHMINVNQVKGAYEPFAGHRICTIRKYRGKYQPLQLGDHVIMHHCDDVTTQGPPTAVEFLTVSAVAIADLDALLEAHKPDSQFSSIKDRILSFYPLPEGEEYSPEDLFIAIYF